MDRLSLAWLLGDERQTCLVFGARRPAHLDPAIAAEGVSLSAAEREEIGALFA